jgi:hypothetical protein
MHDNQYVYCNGCETCGPTKSVPITVSGRSLTEAYTQQAAQAAIEAWNRRISPKKD